MKNPNAPAGTVSDAQTISSKLLMKDRRVWVYMPPGYRRNGSPSDLIVLFDGRMYIDRLLAPITLDNLIAAKRIAPTVAVFIENPFSVRNEELFWNPTYADFVAAELMPWIRTNFNVTKDSRRVVIGGASAGGAGATYAALRHSEVFGNVLVAIRWLCLFAGTHAGSGKSGRRVQAMETDTLGKKLKTVP